MNDENKMMTPENADGKRPYFFPDRGITVEATSQQEADEAVAKIDAGATIPV